MPVGSLGLFFMEKENALLASFNSGKNLILSLDGEIQHSYEVYTFECKICLLSSLIISDEESCQNLEEACFRAFGV